MWLLLLTAALAVVIYFKVFKVYKHWEEKGIQFMKPWPFLGNMGSVFFSRQAVAYKVEDLYKACPKARYMGFYQFLKPTLMIRDPDLIKQITVRDFDAFPEHQTFVPEGIDPIWDKNLFAMKGGDRWHDMRSTLSPSFTSSKMKAMLGLMKSASKQFVSHYQKQGGTVAVETRDAFRRYSNDVIANTAFGVTCDSLENPNNDFFLLGRGINDFTGIRGLLFFINALSPLLMKIFKIRMIKENAMLFFKNIIDENIKIREEKGIVRPDMIHLLMEAKKGRLKHDEKSDVTDRSFAAVDEPESGKKPKRQKAEITNEDITAQAIVFFAAGFESVSTLMSFVAYELAVNPEIQENLIREVDATLEDCNGNFTYEGLMDMKYLDMVVSETLRLWPPVEVTDRISVRNYAIEPQLPGEKLLHLDCGTYIWIPIYAIHRDPQYYPNPEKFDPERFSDDNKNNIKPFTFMPFGAGPRVCIGTRFALLKTKLIICEVLSKFSFVPVEKTQIPLRLKPGFGMFTEKDTWVGLKPR